MAIAVTLQNKDGEVLDIQNNKLYKQKVTINDGGKKAVFTFISNVSTEVTSNNTFYTSGIDSSCIGAYHSSTGGSVSGVALFVSLTKYDTNIRCYAFGSTSEANIYTEYHDDYFSDTVTPL